MQLTHTLGTHTAQTIRLPPPCLTVGTTFLSAYSSPARHQTCCIPSEPKRFTFVSSDHKMVSLKDKGFPIYFRANSKRAVLCLGFKRGFLRGRRPCRFALCKDRRIVAAEMLTPHISDNSQASSAALFLGFCETFLSLHNGVI